MKFSTFEGFIGENTYMYIFMYIDNVHINMNMYICIINELVNKKEITG